jgi:hypothetical protein
MTEFDTGQADAGEQSARYGKTLAIGADDNNHVSVQDHRACITYCRNGRKRRRRRCPACYGPAVILDINHTDIEPWPGRAEQFAAWCGGWVTAFLAAVVFPFRAPAEPPECAVCARAELIDAAARADQETPA